MILKAMHKEPSERFATASVMVDAMSTMTDPSVPLSDDQDATIPIGGVPPRPIVAQDSPPGANDVTVPTAVNAHADSRPGPTVHDAAVTATGDGHPDQRTDATAETSGLRRLVAIGVVALVVLALLFVFMRWDDPETEPTQASSQAAPQITEAPSGPTAATTPPSGRAVAEPAETTPRAITDQPAPATTDAGSASDRAPTATVATAEPLLSVESPSSSEIRRRADVAAAIERNNTLLSAAASTEEEGRRRDAQAAARDPFPDQGDGTFLDRQTGFLWTVASSPRQGNDGLLWTDANTYCQGLTLGSTSNWQLPSRDELDPVLQRLDPTQYPWGLSLWSASRPFGESNRLWVTNSPLYAPEWSSAVRDASARRLTHRAVCLARN